MIEIVLNPSGASGRTKKYFERKIRPLFDAADEEYRIHESTLNHDVDVIVHDLTEDGREHTIVIVGGDGTMNLAVNGLQYADSNKIGYIPCGSGNDLAKALGVSTDPARCVQSILKKEVVRCLDIGELILEKVYDRNDNVLVDHAVNRRFNISCGAGFDAEICAEAAESSKALLNRIGLGRLIYIMTALKVIFSVKTFRAHMATEQVQKNYEEMLLTVGMNTCYEGGGFRFCPKAIGTDGMLDYCIGDHVSRFDFFRIFPYAYSGAHLKFKGVESGGMRVMHLRTERPVWVHTDGEVPGKAADLTIRLAVDKMQMIN